MGWGTPGGVFAVSRYLFGPILTYFQVSLGVDGRRNLRNRRGVSHATFVALTALRLSTERYFDCAQACARLRCLAMICGGPEAQAVRGLAAARSSRLSARAIKVTQSMHILAPDQITPNGRLLRCGCSHLQRWLPNWLSNVNTDTPMTSPSEGQVFGAVNEVARTPNSAS